MITRWLLAALLLSLVTPVAAQSGSRLFVHLYKIDKTYNCTVEYIDGIYSGLDYYESDMKEISQIDTERLAYVRLRQWSAWYGYTNEDVCLLTHEIAQRMVASLENAIVEQFTGDLGLTDWQSSIAKLREMEVEDRAAMQRDDVELSDLQIVKTYGEAPACSHTTAYALEFTVLGLRRLIGEVKSLLDWADLGEWMQRVDAWFHAGLSPLFDEPSVIDQPCGTLGIELPRLQRAVYQTGIYWVMLGMDLNEEGHIDSMIAEFTDAIAQYQS